MRFRLLPLKTDPIWINIINSSEEIAFPSLPTRMLMMRVKMVSRSQTPEALNEAVDIMYEFFAKNESNLKDDVAVIISKTGKLK